MPTTPERRGTLVVGLGNPLMTDDGVGLAALECLRREWDVPPGVTLVDGGTWGMMLLPMLEDAESVIFLDAIRANTPPGTLVELGRDELPRLFALKISPHQIDLREVLALTELRGTLPRRLAAIGIEPALIEMGTSLTYAVEERVDDLVLAAVNRLAHWGHSCRRRPVTAGA